MLENKVKKHRRRYYIKNNFDKKFPIVFPEKLLINDPRLLRRRGVIGCVGVRPKISSDPCVAIDCEMVGVSDNNFGQESMLARVSLVNMSGQCVYDTFVYPEKPVLDYRTAVSGVRPHDMAHGAKFALVRRVVSTLIHNRLLVGHSLSYDLNVLRLKYPMKFIRDTAYYKPFRQRLDMIQTPGLKRLTKELLNMDIQTGEHNSIEDAQAAMKLYMKYREEWEQYLKAHN